jgi:hypothetical protein
VGVSGGYVRRLNVRVHSRSLGLVIVAGIADSEMFSIKHFSDLASVSIVERSPLSFPLPCAITQPSEGYLLDMPAGA